MSVTPQATGYNFTIQENKRLCLKANSYNNQDKKKGRLRYNQKYDKWDPKKLTVEDIKNLINKKGLDCHYCRDVCHIVPRHKLDHNQFTLERLDNNKSHTIENCVVACLSCNELRSDDFSSDHFKEIKARGVAHVHTHSTTGVEGGLPPQC